MVAMHRGCGRGTDTGYRTVRSLIFKNILRDIGIAIPLLLTYFVYSDFNVTTYTMRILIIEDEARILNFLRQGLEEEAYLVALAVVILHIRKRTLPPWRGST